MLTLVGLDEAGFGPLLGPLCTGAASLSLDFDPAEGPPNLWSQLAPVVGRSPRECEIPVSDSKKLKSSSKLPLRNLLAGLVPFVELASSTELRTDQELLCAIGVHDLGPFDADPVSLWQLDGLDQGQRSLRRAKLGRCTSEKGIQIEAVRATATHPRYLNDLFDTLGNKSSANTTLLFGLLREVLAMNKHHESPRIVVDRQGGLMRYQPLLETKFHNAKISTVAETQEISRYRIDREDKTLHIGFETKADARHLPVALASMAAKTVRELLMNRLNAFFAQQKPGLKPTAGYVQDGRRWVSEIGDLPERLQIPRRDLVRNR